jgi:N6-L-threonylcarbamoyladenine synthase
MKILAIETSCDETAVAVLNIAGESKKNQQFNILSNVVASQIKLHSAFGGVVPNIAKREHQKNLTPALAKALEKAKLLKKSKIKNKKPKIQKNKKILEKILEREKFLLNQFLIFLEKHEKPKIDLIAVTEGPGLEPALWVGINFAKALAMAWKKPIIGINHMEGHLFSVFLKEKSGKKFSISNFQFPIIALLVSGGHTELALMKYWLKYKIIGKTRDDAAGEAFDKVARILGLDYPGGPAVAAVASREKPDFFRLPRPMINSKNFDFSFSGLKTAVLYLTQNFKKEKRDVKNLIPKIAAEFQQATIDVLISKTIKAAKKYKAKTIILAGGVAANKELRKQMKKTATQLLRIQTIMPKIKFTGDNAAMIALAAYFQAQKKPLRNLPERIKANGNLTL